MRLTVRNKLLAGFAAVLALSVVLGVVALSKMGTINGSTVALATKSVPSVDSANHINTLTSDFRVLQLEHLVAEDAVTMDDDEAEMKEVQAAIAKQLGVYKGLISDGIDGKLHAQIAAEWARYTELTASVPTLSRANQNGKALAILSGDAEKVFDRASNHATELVEYNVELAHAAEKQAESAYGSAKTLVIVLLVVSLILGFGVALFLGSKIRKGIGQIKAAAEGISVGNLDQNVEATSRDELGETAEAFGVMIGYLRETADVADRVGEGDLSVDLVPRSEDDTLRVAFAKMVDALRVLVNDVSSSASTVSSASQQLASTSEEAGRAVAEIATAIGDVAHGAETQVRRVEDVKLAVTEAAAAVEASAQAAAEAAGVADGAREVAREGVSAAGQASDAMNAVRASSADVSAAMEDLAGKSERIGGIIGTITGIAEQTNLLALNAAIEAARAGEQGRGFAVVAEEVRKLAEESQQAAASIAELIGEIQVETRKAVTVVEDGGRRTEEGTATVERVREAFERIESSVGDMTGRIEEIAAAARQVSASTTKMEEDIVEVARVAEGSSATTEEVSASTEETSASTQQISASAQELSSTAQALEELVGRFQLAER